VANAGINKNRKISARMVLSVLVTIDGMVFRMYQRYLPGFSHYR
jgi:hypothetical protein